MERQWNSPYINRFLSADTIISDPGNPQSLNRYSYVLENPLKYSDPTGHKECAGPQPRSCLTSTEAMTDYIQSKFKKVKIKKGKWDDDDLLDIYTGLTNINYKGFHGNSDAFDKAFGSFTFTLHSFSGGTAGDTTWQTGEIRLDPDKSDWTTVVHEMGHLFDAALKRKNERIPSYRVMYSNVFDTGSGATDYGRTDPKEDFADSFMEVIYRGISNNKAIDKDRITTITVLI